MLSGKSTKHAACVHAGVSLCYLLLRKRINCFVSRGCLPSWVLQGLLIPVLWADAVSQPNARTSTSPTI